MRLGILSSGKTWELVKSRKKSPHIKEGRHLILHTKEDSSLALKEKIELFSLSLILAEEFAAGPGRWQISVKGPAEASHSYFYIHILLPKGDDSLPSLVKIKNL